MRTVTGPRCRAFLLPLLLLPGLATAQSGGLDSAFGERSLYLLHTPILDFGPALLAPLPPGSFDASLELADGNSFSETWHARRIHADHPGQPFTQEEADFIHRYYPNDSVTFVDGEFLRTSISARYGLSREVGIAVEVPYLVRGAYSLDRFIEDFHRAFGVRDVGRTEFPTGGFTVMLQEPGGPMVFDSRAPSSGLGDISISASWRPGRLSDNFLVGADAAIKVPSGRPDDLNGSGSWDGGLLVFGARQGRRWTFTIEASEVFPGAWKIAAVPLRTSPFARILVSASRTLGARTRAGLSVTAAQSPFRSERLDGVSSAGVEVGAGIERDMGRHTTARFTLTDNIPRFGDRADLGLSLRLAWRP